MSELETDSVFDLLRRSIHGDPTATSLLCDRLGPRLKRWARGRLPVWAREGIDTDDLVQETLLRTVLEPGRLEPRPDFQAYVRRAILNAIRDHVRRAIVRRRAAEGEVAAEPAAPSPLEEILGNERLEAYEAALERLSPSDRELLVCRIDFGLSYREIAEATGRASPDAARMAVVRAICRLSEALDAP